MVSFLEKVKKADLSNITQDRLYSFQRPLDTKLIESQQFVVGLFKSDKLFLLSDSYPIQFIPVEDNFFNYVKIRVFSLGAFLDLISLVSVLHNNSREPDPDKHYFLVSLYQLDIVLKFY